MKKLTLEEAIERFKNTHGDKFGYSESIYYGSKTPIKIWCRKHNCYFWQRPDNHINKKYGCSLCSPTGGVKLTQEQYIMKCVNKHGATYDYSKTIFNGVKKKVIILCYKHGAFEQIAEKHFIYGCPACAGNKRKTTEEFVKEANLIHNFYYTYSAANYVNSNTLIKIECPKHGQFEQLPSNHLIGKGCIKCSHGNTSNIEHRWLDYLGLPNDRVHRNVYMTISNRKFIVDGLLPGSNIIYEFLGDFFHGNPKIYNRNNINPLNQKTYGELFDKTVEKIRFLRKNGYKVISIWESKFKKHEKTSNIRIAKQGTNCTKIFRK